MKKNEKFIKLPSSMKNSKFFIIFVKDFLMKNLILVLKDWGWETKREGLGENSWETKREREMKNVEAMKWESGRGVGNISSILRGGSSCQVNSHN